MDLELFSALSYANRAASYIMAFGMPKPGSPDRRPNSNVGDTWTEPELVVITQAILWLEREDVLGTAQKLQDIFAGGDFVVMFDGNGQAGKEFTMKICHAINPS